MTAVLEPAVSTGCVCTCHGSSSTFGTCSVSGGCGHLHRDDASLRCARGSRCGDARRERQTQPDGSVKTERVPAWATTENGLCRFCLQQAGNQIRQLPDLCAELGGLRARTYPSASDGPGSGELPCPIRTGIDALQAAISDELERWHEVLTIAPAVGLHDMAVTLAARVDDLASIGPVEMLRFNPHVTTPDGSDSVDYTEETGVDGILKLTALYARADAVVGRTMRAVRLWAPCPTCGTTTLEHPEGGDRVSCRRCGLSMAFDHYEDSARVLAAAYDKRTGTFG